MMTHTIRLRGPWRLCALPAEPCSDTEAETIEGRATVPGDWSELLGRDYRGRAKYRRVFHRPTGLAIGETVFLVVEQVRSRGFVFLNKEPLGEVGNAPAEFNITDRLDEPNELTIEVEHDPAAIGNDPANSPSDILPGGIPGEVRLEIRSAG